MKLNEKYVISVTPPKKYENPGFVVHETLTYSCFLSNDSIAQLETTVEQIWLLYKAVFGIPKWGSKSRFPNL